MMTSRFSRRLLGGAGTIALAMSLAGTAAAQVPVTDSAVQANTQRAASAIQDQVNLLREVKAINENVLASVGSFGSLRELGGLPQWQEFKDGGKLAQALRQLKPNTCALVACKGEGGGQEAQLNDLTSARNWVKSSLFSAGNTSGAQQRDLAEVRSRAVREAATSGYAVSLMSRDHLAGAADRGTKLETMVGLTQNLRDDVRANSAVALAQYQQMTHMLALVTSLVEMESTAALRGDTMNAVAGGGAKTADVRKDAEYTASGTRRTITTDDEGRAVGGSGGVQTDKAEEALKKHLPGGNANIDRAYKSAAGGGGSGLGGQSASLFRVAAELARAGGQPQLAGSLSRMDRAMASSSSDRQGVVWSGADVLASRGGDSELAQQVRKSQSIAQNNDRAGMEDLFGNAERTAQQNNDADGLNSVRASRDAWRSGQMNNNDAAMNATSVLARNSRDPNGKDVSETLRLDASKASDAELYDYSMDIMKRSGETSANGDLKDFSKAAHGSAGDVKALYPQ